MKIRQSAKGGDLTIIATFPSRSGGDDDTTNGGTDSKKNAAVLNATTTGDDTMALDGAGEIKMGKEASDNKAASYNRENLKSTDNTALESMTIDHGILSGMKQKSNDNNTL